MRTGTARPDRCRHQRQRWHRLETARRARAEGARVILTGPNRERLKQAAFELDAQHTAAFDANDPASLQSFLQDLPTPMDHVMVTARFASH